MTTGKYSLDNLLKFYPKLFQYKDGELLFNDELAFIFGKPLVCMTMSFAYDISLQDKSEQEYVFRLTVPIDPDDPDDFDGYNNRFFVNKNIILTDEACILFFDYGLVITGYDEALIRRRHSIKNIIS